MLMVKSALSAMQRVPVPRLVAEGVRRTIIVSSEVPVEPQRKSRTVLKIINRSGAKIKETSPDQQSSSNTRSELETSTTKDGEMVDPKTGSVVLTGSDLWATGSSLEGQLGIDLKGRSYSLKPIQIPLPRDVGDASIVDFAAGDGWSFVIMRPSDPTKEDFFVSSGQCDKGQIAQWDEKPIQSFQIAPRLDTWPVLPRFQSLVVGRSQTFLIDTDQKMWAIGNNNSGQLGAGIPRSIMDGPFPIGLGDDNRSDYKVSQLVTNFSHSILLTDDGEMWVTGSNHCGQLGTGNDLFTELTFRNVSLGSKVSAVSCGHTFSLVATGEKKKT